MAIALSTGSTMPSIKDDLTKMLLNDDKRETTTKIYEQLTADLKELEASIDEKNKALPSSISPNQCHRCATTLRTRAMCSTHDTCTHAPHARAAPHACTHACMCGLQKRKWPCNAFNPRLLTTSVSV